MEDNSTLFSLSIDPVTKTHLAETAKWAKFLAIVGMIFLLIMIASGVLTSVTISRYEELYNEQFGLPREMAEGLGAGIAVIYIIFAIIAFFPMLFMLRFANYMKKALRNNDQERLNASFQNLKVYFRYTGVILIIVLVLMLISLFVSLGAGAIR